MSTMNQYDIAYDGWAENSVMEPRPNGLYVLTADAIAEIAAAYKRGQEDMRERVVEIVIRNMHADIQTETAADWRYSLPIHDMPEPTP